MTAIDSIIQALKTGGRHLGDLCFWQLAEASVDRATFEARWEAAGLDKALLPEPPTAEKALKVAAREAGVGQQTGQQSRLIRLAVENEENVTFAVVLEEKHPETGTLTYTQEAKVALDRAFGNISSDRPSHEVVQNIMTRFGKLRDTHTADDVRRTITRTLASFSAVTLRESGGVYWVPSPFSGLLRKLQACIQQFGHSEVYLIPVHDSADANKTLGDVATQALQEELDALKSEVQAFVAQPPERPTTLARRFDAFDQLRNRAALYRDILKVQVKDLDSTLDELTTSVETLLATKSQQKAA
jgi:hypothetical protein